MNFDLTEEQELLQEMARNFVSNECPPTRVHELFDAEEGHALELWRGLCELGLGGIQVPSDFGGAGLDLLELALVSEVLGEAAVPGPFVGHSLACLALVLAGSEEQKQLWLPRLVSGELIATVALSEGEELWQPDQWQLDGDSEQGLVGSKTFVPHADCADLIVVGVRGGGLMLVRADQAGVEAKQIAGVDRTRRLGTLTFSNASAEPLSASATAARRVCDAGLVLLSADAIGGAWRCVELSVAHANAREQFGTTIAHFQALKHQLANMAVEVEPARALYWHAAHAFDHLPEEAERSAALAKAHITDRYMQVARDTVEAHGGVGFTWESDVQLYFKRAMFDRAFLGRPEFHRARSVALGDWS
ncbi:MAG: acyl-CoA/acyl-ACP dehydrogenase [bacterium]|nr:acyl-CoA/acyl-ACP dehydrogenase [bacterium]